MPLVFFAECGLSHQTNSLNQELKAILLLQFFPSPPPPSPLSHFPPFSFSPSLFPFPHYSPSPCFPPFPASLPLLLFSFSSKVRKVNRVCHCNMRTIAWCKLHTLNKLTVLKNIFLIFPHTLNSTH